MLSPAAHDLMCRKKLILSTPDRTCHQAPRSVEFLAIRPSLTVYFSCRLTLTAPSNQPGFGGIAINCSTYGVTNRLSFSWENNVQVLRLPITLQSRIPPQHPNKSIHKVTCVTLPETGRSVDDLYNHQDQTPEFALISFQPSSKKGGAS